MIIQRTCKSFLLKMASCNLKFDADPYQATHLKFTIMKYIKNNLRKIQISNMVEKKKGQNEQIKQSFFELVYFFNLSI